MLDRLDQWHPEQAELARHSRPDRAEAMTRAAEYDRWARGKVQTSRDDTRAAISEADWERIRAARLATQRQAS